AGRESGAACRIASGTVCDMSSSISDAPTVESISLMSAGDGPMWRREKSLGSKSVPEALGNIALTFSGPQLEFVAAECPTQSSLGTPPHRAGDRAGTDRKSSP